jgi:8-oxo-dGTP pyrophosphatase MutT (NUDIX family)
MLIDGDKILLEKRAKDKACDPDITAIPGGHMEAEESQPQTLIREVAEELNVVPEQYYHLCSLYHPTSELQLLHYYVVTRWQGNIISLEADAVYWSDLDLARVDTDADRVALGEYLRLMGLFGSSS